MYLSKYRSELVFRLIEYSFWILLLITIYLQGSYIREELNLPIRRMKGAIREATVPTWMAAFLMIVPFQLYKKKRHQPFVAFVAFLYLLIALTVFSLWGHYQYTLNLRVYEAWIIHLLICILIAFWNVAQMIFLYHSERK